MLKHALPCQWNSIHFSFSTRWCRFNAYLPIVWLNQSMLLENTLKKRKKKIIRHRNPNSNCQRKLLFYVYWWLIWIYRWFLWKWALWTTAKWWTKRRRLFRLVQSLRPGTCNNNYHNSIILFKRTNLRPLKGMSGAGSASFLPIFVSADRKKLQNSFQKWKLIIHDYMWKPTKAFTLEPILA